MTSTDEPCHADGIQGGCCGCSCFKKLLKQMERLCSCCVVPAVPSKSPHIFFNKNSWWLKKETYTGGTKPQCSNTLKLKNQTNKQGAWVFDWSVQAPLQEVSLWWCTRQLHVLSWYEMYHYHPRLLGLYLGRGVVGDQCCLCCAWPAVY